MEAGLGGATKLGSALARWRRRRRPLDITTSRILRGGWSVVLPEPPRPDALQPDATEHEVYEWLKKAGGADFYETDIRLDALGSTGVTLSITAMSVVVVDRKAAPRSTLVHYPTGGALDRDVLFIDLDADEPIAVAAQTDDSGALVPLESTRFLDDRVVHVTPVSPWSARIVARSSADAVAWRLALAVAIGRKERVVLVDDGGKPFRTVGAEYSAFSKYVDWAWYETRARFLETGADGLPVSNSD